MPKKRMKATARMASVASSAPPARRRLIRSVLNRTPFLPNPRAGLARGGNRAQWVSIGFRWRSPRFAVGAIKQAEPTRAVHIRTEAVTVHDEAGGRIMRDLYRRGIGKNHLAPAHQCHETAPLVTR